MTAPTESQQQQQPALAWLAAWLVLNHQGEQRSIAADVVKKLHPLWKILDFGKLRETQTTWIQATLPVVEAGYQASQRAAQQFLIDYRHASLPQAPEVPAITGRAVSAQSAAPAAAAPEARGSAQRPRVRVSVTPGPTVPAGHGVEVTPKVIADTPFEPARASVSLLSTGPGEVMRRMPAPEQVAMDAGQLRSSRVAVRMVADGGRQVVRRAVDLDQEAIGWARVLNISPCYFCGMLASRGAVYKVTSFDASNDKFEGEGVAKVHDSCLCGLRPVYSHSDRRDPTAQALWEQWGQSTRGLGGDDAIRAFRRNFKVPDPPDPPRIDLHSLIVARDKLIRDGFAEDSEQVQWMDQQIARFGALL